MHSIRNSIYFILIYYLIGIINAKNTNKAVTPESNNKYYIISIKDSSKYSFNIQPTKQDVDTNKLKKKDFEVPKFNEIDLNEVEDIINSDNCISAINEKNLNDTTLCKLNSDSVIDNGKIDVNELEKKLKPKTKFVSKQMEKLAEIIIDNIDTYKDDDITNELHNEVLKRSSTSLKELLKNKIFSKVLKNTYDILDVTLIYAYLSKEIYEIVKDLPDVVECIEDIKISFPNIPESLAHIDKPIKYNRDDSISNIEKRDEENIMFYNITDIKEDTKWSNVSIETNAPNHLSLLSQSRVDSKLIDKYDSNFYYPSSAGAGVDIYIIDGGININHADFDTTSRNITCDAIITENGFKKISPKSDKYKNCFIDESHQHHGIYVASAAAGTLYGVAKKANIHAVAISIYLSNYISALKYIEEYAINPHKTVINISSSSYYYSYALDKLINIMIRKGFMIIASSGNESTDACSTEKRNTYLGVVNEKAYPASYIDVISVGSMDNSIESEDIPKSKNVYNFASFSNYGNCIDIFAPGYAYLASFPSDYKSNKIYTSKKFVYGTSFSSPLVAGVAAVLISENPDITFDQEILRKMLIDLSVKDVISSLDWLDTPNRFLNIGKNVVYSSNDKYNGCGILSGKKSCQDDSCCSPTGYCGKEKQFCEIDCQSEFGKCSPNNHSSPKKEYIQPKYRDVWIYNYFMDYCIKFTQDNDNSNVILTLCNDQDTDYNWYVSTNDDGKIIQNTYDDVCMSFNEEGIAYANPCSDGVTMKNINTVQNKDAIQSDEFPGMCLKAVTSDYNPYGITIFTESIGLRVMMDTCDYNSEYQHWRLRDIPEVIYDDYSEQNIQQLKEEDHTLIYNNAIKRSFETITNDNDIEIIEINTEIIEEPESLEPETTPSVNVKYNELINDEEGLLNENIYSYMTLDIMSTMIMDDEEPTFSEEYNNDISTEFKSLNDSEYTEYPENPDDDDEDEDIYNEYGQLFNKEDYISSNYYKIVVTNKKAVWIYSEDKKLCLSYPGKYGQQALLEKCDKNNKGQQWLVPNNNNGYYVNKEKKDICIIYTPDKRLIFNECIEEIPLEKLYLKNHAAIIAYENKTLKINDEYNDEELCLNIEEYKKNEALLNMVPCDQSHSKFILTTVYPEN